MSLFRAILVHHRKKDEKEAFQLGLSEIKVTIALITSIKRCMDLSFSTRYCSVTRFLPPECPRLFLLTFFTNNYVNLNDQDYFCQASYLTIVLTLMS